MKRVYKYHLGAVDTAAVEMPAGAKILALQTQRGTPCMWAEVDPNAPVEMRCFRIFGTGHDMPDNPGEYVGTFQIMEGRLVFHVYEAK